MNGAEPTNESTPLPPDEERSEAAAPAPVDRGPIEEEVDAALQDATGTEPLDDSPSEATLESAEGELIEEDEVEVDTGFASPVEMVGEEPDIDVSAAEWYILKVQVNREDSIKDGLLRRVKMHGMEPYFHEVIVPTEDVAEFTKTGKRRVVKRKIYPGYILVKMVVTDETWSLVRETSGIGDFTGAGGKPTPMDPKDVEKILKIPKLEAGGDSQVRTAIPFKVADRVRVKEGYFQNFEGDIDSVDEANGRVTVMINIFGRSTPVELEHWQIEAV